MYFLLSGICFFLAIFLFSNYNSGSGPPLGSIWKKLLFSASLLSFLASIIFLNRGYYKSNNQQQHHIITELKKEADAMDSIIISELADQRFGIQLYNLDQIKIKIWAASDSLREIDSMPLSYLVSQYFKNEEWIRNENDSLLLFIIEKNRKFVALSNQLDSNVRKESDTYFNILINLLSTFLAFVVAFTFKNRILG